ncbi:MAG: site-2 protease family protein [Candidatus Pacearchaeota archaeon]
MKFILIDLILLTLFLLFIVIFLYKKREKLDREGIIYIYRTKWGLKLIEKVSKHKKILNFLSYFSIIFGYMAIMASFILLLLSLKMMYSAISVPSAPPIAPVVPYFTSIFKIDFMPPLYFTYWIIIILIIAISHEFAHGVFAMSSGIKIKSTGFGFLGPFIAAFVEPDEKTMQRKKIKNQLAILSAGSFANFIVTLLFVVILQLFFLAFYIPNGFIGYMMAIDQINLSSVKSIVIGNQSFSFSSLEELHDFLIPYKNKAENETKNETIKIKTENMTYFLDQQLLAQQEKLIKNNVLIAYIDSPAYRENLTGPILEIDGKKIKNEKDIEAILLQKKPNESIEIKTENKTYTIILAQHPKNSSRGFLGISFFKQSAITKIFFFTYPKLNPYLEYKPKNKAFDFVKDLLYWLVIIGISVALFNMLPFSFLDGGKTIYLTFLLIFKNKNAARKGYAFFSFIVILILIAMFVLWFIKV